jgi:hypothetical protein
MAYYHILYSSYGRILAPMTYTYPDTELYLLHAEVVMVALAFFLSANIVTFLVPRFIVLWPKWKGWHRAYRSWTKHPHFYFPDGQCRFGGVFDSFHIDTTS